jgi:hypothetical protein
MVSQTLLVLTAAAALVAAPPAGAKTLGSLAPKDTPSGETCSGCHGFQETTAASSPAYSVPKGKWKITSWRTRNTTPQVVAARLWVFRPTQPGDYKLIGRSDKETVGANEAPSHEASIKVKKGDLIGLESFGDMATFYSTGQSDDLPGAPNCRHVAGGQVVGSGTSCTLYESAGGLLNVTAKLQRR